jgi:hypothetical protein
VHQTEGIMMSLLDAGLPHVIELLHTNQSKSCVCSPDSIVGAAFGVIRDYQARRKGGEENTFGFRCGLLGSSS